MTKILTVIVASLVASKSLANDCLEPQENDRRTGIFVDIENERFRGAGTAPVALIEYGDYQCSYCRSFEQSIYPQVKRRFVDSGKVRFVYRHLPLKSHAFAEGAARAAFCANQEPEFWEFHAALLTDPIALSRDELLQHADELKLDRVRFATCLDSDEAKEAINQSIAGAAAMSIERTPTFLLGILSTKKDVVQVVSVMLGVDSLESFTAAIEGAIAESERVGECRSQELSAR